MDSEPEPASKTFSPDWKTDLTFERGAQTRFIP